MKLDFVKKFLVKTNLNRTNKPFQNGGRIITLVENSLEIIKIIAL